MDNFSIRVPDIGPAGRDYVFPIEKAWAEAVLSDGDVKLDTEAAPGEFKAHAQKVGLDILVTGQLHAELVTPCGRCLGDAKIVVNSDIYALFTARSPAVRPEPGEYELSEEELDREFYTGDVISLAAQVRENLLLEVPMQPLCKPDCQGIPLPESVRAQEDWKQTATGDPRLAVLKTVLEKKE